MKNFKIQEMNMETDKPQIVEWDDKYAGTPEYAGIEKFILEHGLIHGLSELIETNYERIPIGDDEIKKSLTIKNDDGQIIGFMIFQIHDISINKPSMFLQYIVINPEFQHQGYGKEILAEIFSNPKKHLGHKPKDVFCYIDNENYSSQKLFMDFGFCLGMQKGSTLFKATGDMPTIERIMQTGSMGNQEFV